jgi:hypothetical protein
LATRRFGARPTEDVDNFAGAVAPDADNDGTEGYEIGSYWLDVVASKVYICTSNGTGTATWRDITVAVSASVEEYNITNEAADRAYNADATTIDELCDVLGTLINDLIATSLIKST